jgi:hypothetical protein
VLVPIEGKANTFEHSYFRFDLHVVGGPAVVRASRGGQNENAWVPAFGVGFRGFSAKSTGRPRRDRQVECRRPLRDADEP